MSITHPYVALFPGQGSQGVGMGKAFYTNSDRAKELFGLADKVLGFPLTQYCLEGPVEKLTETAITQPAILTVSVICFEHFAAAKGNTFLPMAAAGHSLGEYSALVAAGALSFEDAVFLVHKRGKYMQEAVPAGAGKMVAVLGKEIPEIEAALSMVKGIAEIANVNAPGQVVVAGSKEGVDEFVGVLNGKVKELAVSAPFHCSLMQPAADALAKDLDALTFSDATFPVYANATGSGLTRASEIRQALKDQVCGRVRWVECMENAFGDTKAKIAIEFGHGAVATGLLKRICPEIDRKNVSDPELA